MDEHDAVDDGEVVYRRIHRLFIVPSVQILIQFPAFRPTANDSTGLSVFRSRFLLQPEDALANVAPDKIKHYYVARLAVRDLRNLGLTVVPERNPGGPPGHAVIPELSWAAYTRASLENALVAWRSSAHAGMGTRTPLASCSAGRSGTSSRINAGASWKAGVSPIPVLVITINVPISNEGHGCTGA